MRTREHAACAHRRRVPRRSVHWRMVVPETTYHQHFRLVRADAGLAKFWFCVSAVVTMHACTLALNVLDFSRSTRYHTHAVARVCSRPQSSTPEPPSPPVVELLRRDAITSSWAAPAARRWMYGSSSGTSATGSTAKHEVAPGKERYCISTPPSAGPVTPPSEPATVASAAAVEWDALSARVPRLYRALQLLLDASDAGAAAAAVDVLKHHRQLRLESAKRVSAEAGKLLPDEYLEELALACGTELAPVCAIVGGMIAACTVDLSISMHSTAFFLKRAVSISSDIESSYPPEITARKRLMMMIEPEMMSRTKYGHA